jgi:hypothetical protein
MAYFQRTDGSGALLLAPGDNIAVATRELDSGTQVAVGRITVEVRDRVDVGHKFAVRSIAAGERIVKYGAAIGSATRDIRPGEYIHTHNMRSDYLPTFTLEPGRTFIGEKH